MTCHDVDDIDKHSKGLHFSAELHLIIIYENTFIKQPLATNDYTRVYIMDESVARSENAMHIQSDLIFVSTYPFRNNPPFTIYTNSEKNTIYL